MEYRNINLRNLYIDLLNKIKGIEGVDKEYVDDLVEVIDLHLTALDSDLSAISSVIPEEASATNPLVTEDDLPPAPVNADWNASSGLAQILNKPSEQVKYDSIILSGGWGFDVVTGYYTQEINPGHNIDTTKNAFIALIPSSGSLTPTASESAAYNQVVSFEYGNGQFLGYLKLYSKGRPDDFNIRFVYYKNAT